MRFATVPPLPSPSQEEGEEGGEGGELVSEITDRLLHAASKVNEILFWDSAEIPSYDDDSVLDITPDGARLIFIAALRAAEEKNGQKGAVTNHNLVDSRKGQVPSEQRTLPSDVPSFDEGPDWYTHTSQRKELPLASANHQENSSEYMNLTTCGEDLFMADTAQMMSCYFYSDKATPSKEVTQSKEAILSGKATSDPVQISETTSSGIIDFGPSKEEAPDRAQISETTSSEKLYDFEDEEIQSADDFDPPFYDDGVSLLTGFTGDFDAHPTVVFQFENDVSGHFKVPEWGTPETKREMKVSAREDISMLTWHETLRHRGEWWKKTDPALGKTSENSERTSLSPVDFIRNVFKTLASAED